MPVMYMQKAFHVFLLLAVNWSPSATLNSIRSDILTSLDNGLEQHVAAVIGSRAELPCDTRLPDRNDTLVLVVWYRNDSPVYSFDARADDLSGHWMEASFKGRAQWFGLPISALQLNDVQRRDRATYRCRVDFQVSPTRNSMVALDVVELPSVPVIYDKFRNTIVNTAGPYSEGGDFKLTCTVYGGNPIPRVQWLQDEKVILSLGANEIQQAEGSRSLTLDIRNASRNLLFSTFTCAAENNLLTKPRRTSIKIDLYLRPVSVQIISREQPFSVGREAEVSCRASGARPPALVTWWIAGKRLSPYKQDVENSNETLSILRWTPQKEHNGLVLVCRAEHTKLNHSSIENKLPLNVYYAPVATIQLGAKMNPNDIEEGDDVYFGCSVDANPPAYKVVWEHNGVQLVNNPSRGVILTGNTNLALRNVSRRQAGNFACIASNVEGDGHSALLPLHVIFRPICHKKEPRLVGTALQEKTSVTCQVEAHPPPDTFEWTLNNSAGSLKIDADRYTMEAKEGRSVLTFMPMFEADYGTLSCRATNLAGQQTAPCIYNIVPAMRPDPPANCSVYNLTHDSLELVCIMGYDGGLNCVYIVEVWSGDGLMTNSTNSTPMWTLKRLGSRRKLKIIVYAANARGRSEHVSFTVETAPKQLSKTENQAAAVVNWALAGILCGTLLIVFIICIVFIYIKLKKRSSDYEVTVSSSKTDKAPSKRNSPQTSDDKNPDLIPLSKGVEDQPPEPPPPYAVFVAPSPGPKSSSSGHSLVRLTSSTPLTLHTQPCEMQNDITVGYGQKVTLLRPHREIVTTRTPLLSAHQESCV